MITINVNNTIHQLEVNTSIAQLLSTLKSPVNGIAVAINNIVIPKYNWTETELKDNDDILIIQATQGG
ncbi:sulfur carrier protein ThiS [Mangrovimonas aestuarii]|uniref:sulfur carrier protein ThiS n=1 Tax=Mangrovimonas aestuarii TaxID=3018443 RepID=UPI0023791258|nr:sulfur carrier protein ThiS [Mangrovimonas aestuarii]